MKKFVKEHSTPKKLWKPPSFEDFNVELPCKRIKLAKEDDKSVEVTKIEPKSIEELAVHSKKIEEVQNWFICALCGEYGLAPMLLITGPTGCGKTATVNVVTKLLDVSVLEWINPVDKVDYNIVDYKTYDPHSYQETNQINKFNDFIFRSSKYKTIFNNKQNKQILLIKDFPNMFYIKPNCFHQFLSRYKSEGRCPIIFICTEGQSFNYVNELFPTFIRNSLTNIKFNPVSKTLINKLINTQLKRMNFNDKNKQTVNNLVNSSMGDIRSVISGLEFMSNKSSTQTVTLRDELMDYYNVLGRILYPKIKTEVNVKTVKQTEVSQSYHTLLYDINNLVDKTLNYSNTIIMLSENYLDTFSSLADVTKALKYLSDCDILNAFGEKDVLNIYQHYIAVTGLMLSNTKSKKNSFRPLRSSNYLKVVKTSKIKLNDDSIKFSEFYVSNQTLHLQIIPYLKFMPCYQLKLDAGTLCRFNNKLQQDFNLLQNSCVETKVISEQKLRVNNDEQSDIDDDLNIEDSD